MNWYIPLTIAPGIALTILSTTNIILSLNAEISQLKKEQSPELEVVIKKKLSQLTLLSIAISFLYLSMLSLLLSGLVQVIEESVNYAGKAFLIGGVSLTILALSLLIFYSIRAVLIRRMHLKI